MLHLSDKKNFDYNLFLDTARSSGIHINENLFIKNLHKIGYNDVKKLKSHKNTKYLTLAFQRRFRQSLVNGKIDKEWLLISKNLL